MTSMWDMRIVVFVKPEYKNKISHIQTSSVGTGIANTLGKLSAELIMYGIMTEECVIREIRIDEAAGRDDADSRMTRFKVIIPLKFQSTKILIYGI